MEGGFAAIDPRLLNLVPTFSGLKQPGELTSLPGTGDNSSIEETHSIASSIVNSTLLGAESDIFTKTIRSLNFPETYDAEINDFDATFRHFDEPEDEDALDSHTVGHLALWITKNKSIVPSENQMKGLEIVTAVPSAKLSKWLHSHGRNLLADAKAVTTYPNMPKSSVMDDTYRVRCVESGFRYRPRKNETSESKSFECTNNCGQTFQRKGDWCRHEKVNFEEWGCPYCHNKVLSRYEHLQKHFKDAHPGMPDKAKQRGRHFLAAKQRPCGFCGTTLANWNAWLFHVASHFEGSVEGGSRTMSHWTEYRFLGKDEAAPEVAGPVRGIEGNITALEPPSSYSSSFPLFCAPEPLDMENDREDKSDRNGDGQIGFHPYRREPRPAILAKASSKIETANGNEVVPSVNKNDETRQQTHLDANRDKLVSGARHILRRPSIPDTRAVDADDPHELLVHPPPALHPRHESPGDDTYGSLPPRYGSPTLSIARLATQPIHIPAQRRRPSVVQSESSSSSFDGMYGFFNIQDTGSESTNPYRHRYENDSRRQ